jgi:hypothetical protein
MKRFEFSIQEKSGRRPFSCQMKGAIICGYTGRDQAAVRAHIEELEKEGIEPPPSVPMFFQKPFWGLSTGEEMHVQGKETSGEVEFVLLLQGKDIYVGVGSDHTDRELEKLDILKSKQVCPSMISRDLWNYSEVKDHWDRLEFRSWAFQGGKKQLYQESTLDIILPPDELLDLVRGRVRGDLEGIAIYSGTSSLLTETFFFAERFEGELLDPVLDRKIRLGYDVRTLEWFMDG